MDVVQTKKINSSTVVTTMNDDQYAVLADSDAKTTLINKDNLRAALHGNKPDNLSYDNILIAYKDKDDWTRMVHLDEWPALQANGKYALGVVVNYGGEEPLIVAPTGASSMLWSSASVSGGGVTTENRRTAIKDFKGESNTAAQILKSACADSAYAPGFCAAYSRANSDGYGYLAGAWWLPSSGELNVIWAHIHQINYALSLIDGAEQIPFSWHWSSTEYSAPNAWNQYFFTSYGNLYGYGKSSHRSSVRPVTAYK